MGEAECLRVASVDGTSLAVWVAGEGPPIVLVHGSLCDHTRFEPLVSALRGRMTSFAMDRRGFGSSQDTPPYAIEREFEDVAAVVDAVAVHTGQPVTLWGHSYGAGCAMGGAALTANVSRLLLYEPSLGLSYPPGSVDAVEQALDDGDHEAAIRLVFVGILEMTEDDFASVRQSALWPVRVASAPLAPRECRVEEAWSYTPGRFDAISAPTLLISGGDTPPIVRDLTHDAAAAIRGSSLRVIPGHGHFAFQDEPELVADLICEFIGAGDNPADGREP